MGSRSLALDADGHPHISYGEDHLYYAWYDGIAWHRETPDTSRGVGPYTSLALDEAGRPHISYFDQTHAELRYAYFDGSSWHKETVDSSELAGYFTSLALDVTGRPHISYYEDAHHDLKYAYHDGISWRIETVDSEGDVGLYTSLALDAVGRPHIGYYDGTGTGRSLKYAFFDGTSWRIEVVDSTGGPCSLALDADGRPHIGYYDAYPVYDLKYAWGEGCIPVVGASIAGPGQLPVGRTGLYTSTCTPPTATQPVAFIWDNGTLGESAVYSWSVTGTWTIVVTATNRCGQAVASSLVGVFCQPLEEVSLAGPGALLAGQEGTYLADFRPITASLPLTFTWDSGTLGPKAVYSWPATGTYTITVTGTNVCGGEAVGRLSVRVLSNWPRSIYLPLVLRDS